MLSDSELQMKSTAYSPAYKVFIHLKMSGYLLYAKYYSIKMSTKANS